MLDKVKESNKDTTPANATPQTVAREANLTQPPAKASPEQIKAEEKAKKTSSSRGEKLFDWLTYGGIAFMGVFVATMPWTYWTKYGSGKKFHDWLTTSLKNRGVSEAVAEQTFNTAVLGSLGNAAVVPVKLMENYKPQLVDTFNDMLGDKSNDASVSEDPKQTWTSLIKSRVAAYAAVFVGLQGAVYFFGGDKFKKFEEKFSEHVVCKPLNLPTHTPGLAKTVANETKAFRYGKIGALDVFATAAATILLYTSSRFFAKKNERWISPKADADLKSAETQNMHETTQLKMDADLTPALVRFADKIQSKPTNLEVSKHENTYADARTIQKQQNQDKIPSLSA